MKNKNKLDLLSKILAFLIFDLIVIAVFYASNNFNKESMNKQLVEENIENNTLTESFSLDKICLEDECKKDFEVNFSNEKTSRVSIYRNKVQDAIENSLEIDGKKIDLDDGAVILEVGVLQSKYYVISYEYNSSKTFYYLDEELRDVKTVVNVPLDTEITSLNYNYYVCQEAEGATGDMMKYDYEMNILKNGTFLSKIINSEEGFCN